MKTRLRRNHFVAVLCGTGLVIAWACIWALLLRGAPSRNQQMLARVVERSKTVPDVAPAQIKAEFKEIVAAAEHAIRSAGQPIGGAAALAATFEKTLAAYRSSSADELISLYSELGLVIDDDRRNKMRRTWPMSSVMISGRKVDPRRVRARVIARPGMGVQAPAEPNVFQRWASQRGENDVAGSQHATGVVELSIHVTRQENGAGLPYWFGIGFSRRPSDGKWIPVSLILREVQERPVMMPSN